MDIKVNRELLLKVCEEFINTPSPVSYYDEIHPLLENTAEKYGHRVFYDRKRTGYISLTGEDDSKTVCVGAHLDTLGLMVRHINEDGTLQVRALGGLNFANVEGESVCVHTRDGKKISGTLVCLSHSVHVFDDARTRNRDERSIIVVLDELVSTAEDVLKLGIEHGDIISIDPRFQYTQTGFIKSRFIDDKAAVAAVFAMLDYLDKNHLKPKYNTLLAFPLYEEIGHGGAYVPEEVSEYVALDIGLIGPDYHGSETKVSICAKDNYSPYDRGLTTHIINLAKKIHADYCVDIFYHYGTDANAAIRAGNNIYAAAFGMGCFSSHGMERCHIRAVEETTKLLIAYVLDL